MPRRPKAAAELRSFILHVRFTEEQRRDLQAAADAAERDLSDWARRLVLKEAAKVKERAARKK